MPGGRVFVGRDTRGSGPELEAAFARGVVAAGGTAVLAGVVPTPAVALLALDLGAVISASHNPPEYNGVKLFDRDGRKLTDAPEEEIEALSTRGAGRRLDRARRRRRRQLPGARPRALRHRPQRPQLAVDCANGAYAGLAPQRVRAARRRGAAIGDAPDGDEHQRRLRRDRSRAAPAAPWSSGAATSGSPSTVTATGCSRSTSTASAVDGDQIISILALAPRGRDRRGHGDDEPRLPPADGGARDPRRHHRRRRPLRARSPPP